MGLDRAGLLRVRARNAERLHAVGQSGRLEPEKPGRATAAVDFPTRLRDRSLDIVALEPPDVSICEQGRGATGNKSRAAACRPRTREAQRLVEPQPTPVRPNDCALDDVRELAHVARPIILFEGSDVGRSQAGYGPVQALTRQSQEVCSEQCDVVLSTTKRWQLKGEQAQTIVEVLAEPPGLHLTLQDPIGSGDDSHVHTPRPFFPDSLELSLLQHPQKLGLERKRNLPDLIEEQCPPIGQLEASHSIADRASEGALDVAEELTLEQVGVDRGAVHTHERAVSPRATVVDG